MNKIILIGRLTAEPELRYSQNGTAVASFTLAVNRKFKKDEADFIPIVVWNKPAESCANYLKKGSQVAIEGRIQTRSYETQDGQKRKITEVIADSVEFLSKASGNQVQNSTQKQTKKDDWGEYGTEVDKGEDEIPF